MANRLCNEDRRKNWTRQILQRYKIQEKIPQLTGSRIEMCGDNFYKLIQNELKHTGQTQEHVDVDVEKQDTRGIAFLFGKDFFYFGSLAIELPHDKSWSEFIVRKFQNYRWVIDIFTVDLVLINE